MHDTLFNGRKAPRAHLKLELMLSALPYSFDEARRTAFFCAALLFPRHFSAEGLIPR